MKYYGKAEETATKILEAFKLGTLAKAIAPVFVQRKDDIPCRAWSWNNQILTILSGTSDARGFRQWQEVNRNVMKGAKAFHILAPITKKFTSKDVNGAEREHMAILGFKTVPVFAIESTEGEPLVVDASASDWIDSLPLIEVARAWGINVDCFNGAAGRPLGRYMRRMNGAEQAIALGVKNLSTWAHELMHASDFRLGNLKEHGQHWRSETVAELGASVLLQTLGMANDADIGGCWDYVSSYATAAGIEPVAACMDVLKRTCDAVNLVLTTAEQLNVIQPTQSEAA